MKFSFYLPVGHLGPEFQTSEAVGEMVAALERARVDACNVTDHPAPETAWLHANGHDALDPFTALAFAAAKSTTLRLHTYIVVLPYRNPFLTAKAAATLQVLSGGRLTMGVGAGYQKGEFDALGVDFHKRGALMDDALETIRMAWAGGVVAKRGPNYNAPGNEPRPAPDPAPLIWVGGGSDKAIERAARFGDGWNPFLAVPTMSKLNRETGLQSSQDLREKIGRVTELRIGLGKTGPFDIAIDPLLNFASKSPADAKQCIARLSELAEAGLTWAIVDPLAAGAGQPVKSEDGRVTRAQYIETVQWFGEEVIAKVRRRERRDG